jgi:hypothetical protein
MHWAEFERFCGMLVRLLRPSASVHLFGGQGDRQDGIDLYVEEADGTVTTFQCKKYRPSTGFGPARVRAAVAANSHQAASHIIVLSCPATAPARREIMGALGWDIWDSEDIADIIREKLDRDAQIQLVDRFFPGHRKDFLGIAEQGPWLTAERFFLSSDDPMALVNHTRPLVGRQEISIALTTFCSGEGRDRVAILSGAGGSGKTRVLKAVADAFLQDDSPIRIRFLSPYASARPGQVEHLPSDQAVLIIDDAHMTPDLEMLFGAIATQRPKLRIIAATRPNGVARIRGLAQRTGLADQPLEVPVSELTLAEATALAKQVLTWGHPDQEAAYIARDVAALMHDHPLATVLTAELINRRRIPVQSVSGDPAFRQRIGTAFEDVLTGGVGDPRDSDKLGELLEFFALLQPLMPDHGSFDELLRLVLARSRDELRRPMAALQAAGVLLLRDGRMWLVPDALADIIAERACLDPVTGHPSGYPDRLFGLGVQGAGLPLRNLLVNVGKLDWHLSGGTGGRATGLLDRIWQQIGDRFARDQHPAQRAALLQSVAEVAYYQPRRALHLAGAAVRDLKSGTMHSDPADTNLLTRELVNLLRNAAYTYEEAPAACELLWTLAKIHTSEDRAPSTPVKALREIAAYGPGKRVQYHQDILETALGWLHQVGDESDPSPFDVLDVFLATEASETEYGQKQVTIRSFTVDPAVVRPLRNRVIDAAVTAVKTGTTQQAIRALKTLESALYQPAGPADRIGDIRRCWEGDSLRVLQLLRDLAAAPLDPLLYCEIHQIVRWHARHGDPAVRDASRVVQATVPDTLQVRLVRCLVEGREPPWSGRNADQSDGVDITSRTAREFSLDSPDATAAASVLRESLGAVSSVQTGRELSPGPFTDLLIRLRPDIGEAIVDDVAADVSSPATAILPVVLESLSATSAGKAVTCARKLLEVGDRSIDLQVARAYGPGLSAMSTPTADEIALIEDLAKHPAPEVRTVITLAAQRIMQTDRFRAIQLLLEVDFAGNSSVAGNVLFQLCSGPVSLDALPPADRIALLHQLAGCPDIHAHSIEVFLEQMARLHPDELIAMLMTRIDHGQGYGWGFSQVLPFAWEHRASSPVLLHDHPRLAGLLDTLLDWLNNTSGHSTVLGGALIAAVAGSYDDTVITILQSWLQAHVDRRGIETMSSCLRASPASVLLDQHLFITSLLESAESFGPDCLAAVKKDLFQAAITSPPAFRAQTLAAQAQLRDGAQQIATQIPPRSPARAFYRDLADHAGQMFRWASAS